MIKLNTTDRFESPEGFIAQHEIIDLIQQDTRTRMQKWADTVGDFGISFSKASADLAKKGSEAMEYASERVPEIAEHTGGSVRNLFKGIKSGWNALWNDKPTESTPSQN